jgi:hypothetical protein
LDFIFFQDIVDDMSSYPSMPQIWRNFRFFSEENLLWCVSTLYQSLVEEPILRHCCNGKFRVSRIGPSRLISFRWLLYLYEFKTSFLCAKGEIQKFSWRTRRLKFWFFY